MTTDRILGIDLGTTNSACCIWESGAAKFIPNSLGDVLTPSAVSFDKETLIVGKIAKQRMITHPETSTTNFKRFMGTGVSVKLAGRSYLPEELSAMVLKSLKEDAEKYLQSPVNHAVISVPAYFNDIQRKATKRAGAIAGLEVDRVINEPSAAALAYGINLEDDKTFLVLDLGGGTFDVSVIEYFDKIIEIKASAGDNYLGGEDFLHALELYYLDHFSINQKDLSLGDHHNLLDLLEHAKRSLSNNQMISVPNIVDKSQPVLDITREKFESISNKLLERIKTPIIQAVRDSKIEIDEIDNVILVGGASRMPAIKKMIGVAVGQIPTMLHDPDTLIAAGAGIQAALKEKNEDLSEHVLTDICPFSLGVGVHNENSYAKEDDLFSPIIERNCPIPASYIYQYTTISNNQKMIKMGIYQGESRFVKNNIKIGELNATVPSNKAGKETINVRFSYDMNGILDIDVEVVSTGIMLSSTILNTANDLSEDEISQAREKLALLKFHPRETHENVLIVARADKLYQISLGEDRSLIEENLRWFENILEKQTNAKIDDAKISFVEFLDDMERFLNID